MIGQNLLHKRLPAMNGLMSTTLGPINQFDIMSGILCKLYTQATCIGWALAKTKFEPDVLWSQCKDNIRWVGNFF